MINIYRSPATITTPYSPVYFDCSSDSATITTVIADVYVNGVLVSTIDKEPLITTTDSFRFEVGEILKKHFTLDLEYGGVSTTELVQSEGSALNYKVRLFEVLDNGTTLDTSWSESGVGTSYVESSTFYSFDGVLHYSQNIDDYICTTSSDKVLSNRPFISSLGLSYNTSKLLKNIPFEVGILSTVPVKVTYSEYTSSGSLISSATTSTLTPTNKKVIFQHNGTFAANCGALNIVVKNAGGSAISVNHIYEVVEECGEEKVIFWKNQYGAYDYYFFSGTYKKEAKSKDKTYEKRLDFGYNRIDRGETVRVMDNTEEFDVYTKTENYKVIDWLHEITQSQDVYLYDYLEVNKSNRFTPIIITGNSAASINTNNPVPQFQLSYVYSNKKYTQVG